MRYLWGQGRAVRPDEDMVGGMAGAVTVVESVDGSAGASVEGGNDGLFKGDMFVGPLSTYSLMRSGVFAGVTLSMNWNEGRSSTEVLLSEWSGTGMSDAESMSLCSILATCIYCRG